MHPTSSARSRFRRFFARALAIVALAPLFLLATLMPASAVGPNLDGENLFWAYIPGAFNGDFSCDNQYGRPLTTIQYGVYQGNASGTYTGSLRAEGTISLDALGNVSAWTARFHIYDAANTEIWEGDETLLGGAAATCNATNNPLVEHGSASGALSYTARMPDPNNFANSLATDSGVVTIQMNIHQINDTASFSWINQDFLSNAVANTPLGNPAAAAGSFHHYDVTATFTGVSTAGITIALPFTAGPPPPPNFVLNSHGYFDVITTAQYASVVICVSGVDPTTRLLHFDAAGVATDVTAPGYPDLNGVICSVPLTSLSPFALGSFTTAVDTSPPTTQALVSPAPNSASWNNGSVAVSLAATDPDGTADVAEIDYSATGAQSIAATTVAGNTASFNISAEGITTVSYFAKDRAGNTEVTHTLTIQIDKTPPNITYTGNAGTYQVDQTVNITCSAVDPISNGVASGIDAAHTSCASVSGPAYSFPLGMNAYSATASDLAGNSTSFSGSFTVQVSYGSLCNLTLQFVTSSANFQKLPPWLQALIKQYGAAACTKLSTAKIAPDPDDKAKAIAAYQKLVTSLVQPGWLTQDQANTLIRLSNGL